MRQAIISTNADSIHWRVYAAKGRYELINAGYLYLSNLHLLINMPTADVLAPYSTGTLASKNIMQNKICFLVFKDFVFQF